MMPQGTTNIHVYLKSLAKYHKVDFFFQNSLHGCNCWKLKERKI